MSIEQLERKIQELENTLRERESRIEELLQRSEKAMDTALHAYKLDAYGFLWTYNADTKLYVKTNMRVMSPEIVDKAIKTRHLADKCVTGEKIEDNAIGEQHIKDKTIQGRSIAPNAIGTQQLQDRSITGDSMEPNAADNGKLADDAVSTRTIQKHAVIPEKLSKELLDLIYSKHEHGIAVSDEFGDNDFISVSQKALTQAFNRVWSVLDDFTGEVHQGINMLVSPDYFIGEDACDIHITASTVGLNGPFEHIELLVNGTKIAEADDVDYYEFDTQITETSVIMCRAKIMGITYEQQKVVTHHHSFWLGAGTSYDQIMDVEHVIPIANNMRGAYNVPCNAGDHLFVIVASTLRAGFIRADMNGAEIAFTESTVTIDGKEYNVLTSENTFQAATYNIDING